MKGDERQDRRHVREKPLACCLRRLLFQSLKCPKFSFLLKGDERHDRRHVREKSLACLLMGLSLRPLKSIKILFSFLLRGMRGMTGGM